MDGEELKDFLNYPDKDLWTLKELIKNKELQKDIIGIMNENVRSRFGKPSRKITIPLKGKIFKDMRGVQTKQAVIEISNSTKSWIVSFA